MKFLLINTNQIVQKLVEITAKKAGIELTSIADLNQVENLDQYEYVIVDDDCLLSNKKLYLESLKNKPKCLIYSKGSKRIEGFDEYIQKPFLPASILNIFTQQLNHKQNNDDINDVLQDSSNTDNDDINLDNLDESLSQIDSLLAESDDIMTLDNEENPQDISPTEEKNIAEEMKTPQEENEIQNEADSTEEDMLAQPEETNDEDTALDIDLNNLDALDDIDDEEQPKMEEENEKIEESIEPKEIQEDIQENEVSEIFLEEENISLETLDAVENPEIEDEEQIIQDEELKLDELEALEMDKESFISPKDTQNEDIETLQAINEHTMGDINTNEEVPLDEDFSADGLLENDLLEHIDTIELKDENASPESVLDKEQISEINLALNALDKNTQSEEVSDFATLKESEVAQALGEELEGYGEKNIELSELDKELKTETNTHSTEKQPNETEVKNQTQEAQIVKDMIASSVQSGISSLSSSNLKTVLDGLEVTINISFKDKSK